MREIEEFLTATGDTWVKEEDLIKAKPFIIKSQLEDALANKEIYCKRIGKEKWYTLPYIARAESSISRNVVRHVGMSNNVPDMTVDEIDALIKEFEDQSEAQMGFRCELHEEQRNAVRMAVNSHMCIVTGGPGTGKTTVINAIIYVEKHRKGRNSRPLIRFCAPTGKAARRITESVKVPAKTVQKLMGANDFADTPYEIACDIVVVDEISMLDTVTLYQLMRSLSDSTRLFLVGDVDQLPSVGVGSCLRDLIASWAIPVTKLEKTFRQKEGSCLADNINNVRHGVSRLDAGDDFRIISEFDDNKIVDLLVDSVLDARERYGGDNVVLLTPFRRKGKTCSNEMNKVLQNIINPQKSGCYVEADIELEADNEDIVMEKHVYHVNFRVGDPVMQLQNRKDCPIANGDVGKIIAINDGNLVVDYGHYIKQYEPSELSELALAYAMSVHKSQGSEYKCVVTCILPEHERLLNRNMIYTDITRAKKECIIYCKGDVLEAALKVEGGYIRNTFLQQQIETEKRKKTLLKTAACY